jgi:hypothetical protein
LVTELKDRFKGSKLAVLGSGPSLSSFNGGYDCAIAVNGAAFLDYKYDYFMCGDFQSSRRDWFLSSRRMDATRIIANFIAPFDPIVVPETNDRNTMQALPIFRKNFSLRSRLSYHRFRKNRSAYYDFIPIVEPCFPHQYFYYNPLSAISDVQPVTAGTPGETPRFYFGATIAGVALQLASYMGASEVHLYGVDMNNFDGKTYFEPEGNSGRTSEIQVRRMAWLTKEIQQTGTRVIFHSSR